MGKMPSFPSPPPAPEYKLSKTVEDGRTVSEQFMEDGKITTKMITPEEELANKERRESDIKQLEIDMGEFRPKLNTLEPEFQADVDREAKAMYEGANTNFQSEFKPLLRELQEESSKKFGTLKNSFYEDERNKLFDIAAKTQKEISTDVEGRKSEIRQQEFGNRQSYFDALGKQLAYLQQGVNDWYDKSNQRYQQTIKSADLYNNFNMQGYGHYIQGWSAQQQARAQAYSARMSMWGGIFSDERLKENIVPIQDALSKVEQLGGYTFNWHSDGPSDVGVIAQEVEKVFPEIVNNSLEYKRVRYELLVPVLIEAIKELNQEVKALKCEKLEAIGGFYNG